MLSFPPRATPTRQNPGVPTLSNLENIHACGYNDEDTFSPHASTTPSLESRVPLPISFSRSPERPVVRAQLLTPKKDLVPIEPAELIHSSSSSTSTSANPPPRPPRAHEKKALEQNISAIKQIAKSAELSPRLPSAHATVLAPLLSSSSSPLIKLPPRPPRAHERKAAEQNEDLSLQLSSTQTTICHSPNKSLSTPNSARRTHSPLISEIPLMRAASTTSSTSSSTLTDERDEQLSARSLSLSLTKGIRDFIKSSPSALSDPWGLVHERLQELAFDLNLKALVDFSKAADIWEKYLKHQLNMCNRSDKTPENCPLAIQEKIREIACIQKLMSEGVKWVSDDIKKLNRSNISQLWRGQFQFEQIEINGVCLPTVPDDVSCNHDSTKPYTFNHLPDSIKLFYLAFIATLNEKGFILSEKSNPIDCLERLLRHEPKKSDRQAIEFFRLTNMQMWGYCDDFLSTIFPLLLGEKRVYILNHNRIGRRHGKGVPNATTCKITVNGPHDVTVTQTKKYRVDIIPKGMVVEYVTICTFSVSWEVPLPKKGEKFSAIAKIFDFEWEEETAKEQKDAFIQAFLNINKEASQTFK